MLPLLLAAALQAASPAPAAATTLPAADQIAAAVLAAPADRRAGAMVLGYDEKGALVTLRPGTNDIVCLADSPKDDRAEIEEISRNTRISSPTWRAAAS